jgi:hypothetical protein
MIQIIIEQISENNYIDNSGRVYLPKPNVVSSATLGDLTIEDY